MVEVAARALRVAPTSRGEVPHRSRRVRREAAASCSGASRGAAHWTSTSPATTRRPSRLGAA
eukprot:14220119-Alexandrium_andersonii.AAC.1